MNELHFFRLWAKEVQKKKNWSHYSDWTNHEFQILSEEISEKVKFSINRNTIRKIIENIDSPSGYNPYTATKDALAQYIEYKSWQEFRKKSNIPTSNRKQTIKQLSVAAISVIALLIIGFYVFIQKQTSAEDGSFEFEIENPVGVNPHTIVSNYDVSKLKTDNIKIDYGQVNADGKYVLVDVSKQTNINKACFHYPGSYDVRLFVDDKVVSTKKVWIYSNDWFVYAIDAKPYINQIELPEMLKKAGVPPLQFIPFSSILDVNTSDGLFHVPEERIMAIDGQDVNYHLHLKYFKPFGIDLRDSKFSIRFKDENFAQGVSCSEMAFYLHCEKDIVGFKFAQRGCDRYTHERIGSYFKAGQDYKLEHLILNYSDFRTLSVISDTDKISLVIDDVIVKTFDGIEDFGEIRGIHIFFKGSPYIDYVRLLNREGKAVFVEDFD